MEDLLPLQQAPLPTRWAGRPLKLLAQTGSTSDDAREAARAGAPQGFSVVADAQTAGRGRRGRAWHSPPGASVYLSMVLRPALSPAEAPVLTLACGLAVRDAAAEFVRGREVRLKWPNDVRVDGRKLAGLLVEGSLAGESLQWAVLGVGLNVRESAWPEELRDTATSLEALGDRAPPRAEVLRALFAQLERRVEQVQRPAERPALLAELRARCETLGQRVRVEGVEGLAESLEEDGGLALRTPSGERVVVRAGEVQLLRWESSP